MGPSYQETGAFNNLNNASGFATSAGEADITNSSAFMNAILSGDPAKISQLLAPQIRAQAGATNQQAQTMGQFGTRSGGVSSAGQTLTDSARANVNDMISSLTGQAASGLASQGSSLLGMGMSGYGTAFGEANTMQNQRASQWNDLFSSIGGLASGIFSAIPGNPGGFADYASNIGGAMS